MLMLAASVLVVALGLDNAALAAALAESREGARRAVPYGLAATGLAGLGLALGRLTRQYAGDWTPLLGVVIVFALWMDAMRAWSRGLPRTSAAPPPGTSWWLAAALACAASLDELGVGFALGGLKVGPAGGWLVACAAETALGWLLGLRLPAGLDGGGRRLLLFGALALFAGYSLTLLGSVALAPPGGA